MPAPAEGDVGKLKMDTIKPCNFVHDLRQMQSPYTSDGGVPSYEVRNTASGSAITMKHTVLDIVFFVNIQAVVFTEW